MTMLPNGVNFDPRNIIPFGGSKPQLPVGSRLLVTIVSSELSMTKNQAGTLNLEFLVMEGDHAGRRGISNFLIGHSDQTTVEIAKSKLAAVCYAVGRLDIGGNIAVLHNIPFRVDVNPSADPKYTEITAFYDANGTNVGQLASHHRGQGQGQGQAPAPQFNQPQQQQPSQVPAYNPNAAAPVAAPGFGQAPQQQAFAQAPAGFPAAPQQQQQYAPQQPAFGSAQPQVQPAQMPAAAPGFGGGNAWGAVNR